MTPKLGDITEQIHKKFMKPESNSNNMAGARASTCGSKYLCRTPKWMHQHTIKLMETNSNITRAKEPASAGCHVAACSLSLGEGTGLESNAAWNRCAAMDHPEFERRIHEHGKKMELERDQLRHAIREVRNAKGRYHTQKAFERLLSLLPENAERTCADSNI